ncbi:MAG: ABC transporter ATP-binding protein [Desulfomonilia bacterium]
MDLLRVQHITSGYERRPVIRDITFTVPFRGIMGIIGPNGAGKTTLFRTIGRVLKPMDGKILYRGRDIAGIPRREFARKVAVIPQFRSAPPPFTVEEFVSLGRYPHRGRLSPFTREDRRIIAENLDLLGLKDFSDRKVNALSGGELQRVVLAQGLVQKPELLLMDEPTAHLDITHKIRVLDLVGSLSKQAGLTVLIILHDLNLAGAYCDRVLIMKGGEVHSSGTPDSVLTQETIEEAYHTPVRVGKDPLTAKPHIYFLPQAGTAMDAAGE